MRDLNRLRNLDRGNPENLQNYDRLMGWWLRGLSDAKPSRRVSPAAPRRHAEKRFQRDWNRRKEARDA